MILALRCSVFLSKLSHTFLVNSAISTMVYTNIWDQFSYDHAVNGIVVSYSWLQIVSHALHA